jgi:hypothetical protein
VDDFFRFAFFGDFGDGLDLGMGFGFGSGDGGGVGRFDFGVFDDVLADELEFGRFLLVEL